LQSYLTGAPSSLLDGSRRLPSYDREPCAA
jgi:hypothetical protein